MNVANEYTLHYFLSTLRVNCYVTVRVLTGKVTFNL